jgi:hypothetical protein
LTSLAPGGEVEKRHHTKGTLLVPLYYTRLTCS